MISEEEIDSEGETTSQTYKEVGEESGDIQEERDVRPVISDDFEGQRRKYYFDGGQVEIVAHLVYDLDPDGKQLRVIKFTDYAAEKVRTLCPTLIDLRKRWADADLRAEVISHLQERGIDFDELRTASGQPGADPFDLLCHVAFGAPVRSRRERADKLRKEEKNFFDKYTPQARAVLNDLLEKYAEHGTAQFAIPDVLKVPPISERGNVIEIAQFFGGPEKLKEAVNELQTLLYAA